VCIFEYGKKIKNFNEKNEKNFRATEVVIYYLHNKHEKENKIQTACVLMSNIQIVRSREIYTT